MEKLDLHKLNYDQARAETIRFIEKYWGKSINLEIITGYSLLMQKAVIGVLDEYKLKYRIGDVLGLNRGYIVVSMEN